MDFTWEIELPERDKVALGGRRPRGTLVIRAGEGKERISAPVAVLMGLDKRLEGLLIPPASRAELLFHLKAVSEECAMSRVARLVDRRDYSRAEIRAKLAEDGYTPSCVDHVVERATSSGLVDDLRFADVFIRTKVASGWGTARIARELSRRGIEVADVPGWPLEYLGDDSEADRAYQLVCTRRVPGKNAYPKLVRFLAGRGFSLGDATRAVSRYLSEQE